MNNLEELAHIIRNNVFNAGADPFDISEAQVFAFDREGCLRILAKHQDPYRALWTASCVPLKNEESGIGIITVGWAAPMCDTNTAPSEHPNRRPIHLITITSQRHEAAAILTFHDETKNEITFLKGVTGQLADALHNAMRIISGWSKTISTN
jgi:hypothetical protein